MKAGWQTSTLGDVLAVIRNGVNCKQDKSGNGDRISRIESISDATFDLDKVGYAELSEREKEKNRLHRGDILFSHINSAIHVGKTAVFDCDEPVYHGVNLLLMRPKEVVTSAYLDHALKYLFQSGYWRGVCKQSVNQASVNQQDISRVEIRYPQSLAEQQRIVGLLDEAFEGLATAKSNAEKNLQNARALFESHLQSVFAQRGPGWVEKKLSALYKIGSSKRVLKSEWKTEGVPFYRGREVTRLAADGFVDNELFISEEHFADLSKEYGVPEAGDIVITAIGTIGNAHVVRRSDRFYFKDASVLWMKRTADVSSEFIRFWLKSSLFLDQLDRGNGATVDTLTIQKLQSVELRLPQLVEQKKIITELNALTQETQRLARLYEKKLAALESLKKSLLHQAFTGELL